MSTWRTLHNNPKLWDRYFIREKVIRATRSFFDAQEFHEVETPLLIAHPPAESYLEVFETTLLDRQRRPTKAYLSTSPEVPLKKLMVAGLGNCYAITKSFRNMETQSGTHNPEFTILEWYRVGADYHDIMKDCEDLLLALRRAVIPAKAGTGLNETQTPDQVGGDNVIEYQGNRVDLSAPWERLTMSEAFGKYAAVNFDDFLVEAKARTIAEGKGYRVQEDTTWEQLFNQIFLNEIEPKLGFGKPTILYEFPGSMGALAKKKVSDPRFAERFEFYIAGLELGDAYSELTDPVEQEKRFQAELKEIKRMGKTSYEHDHDFIDALKVGLPTCSGIAVGLDRLVMLLSDVKSIDETLFFPASEEFSV